MATPLTILRPSTTRVVRQVATAAAGPMASVLLLAVVVRFLLGHPTTAQYRFILALALFGVIWSSAFGIALVVVARRTGYYVQDADVGTITLGGKLRPAAPRVVRWVRRTRLQPGSLLRSDRYPIVFGMDAEGRCVLTISGRHLSRSDVERFLEATRLPAEGDWAEEVRARETLALFPSARRRSRSQVRRLVWMFVGGLLAALAADAALAFFVAGALVR
jgi:hypothetical protein